MLRVYVYDISDEPVVIISDKTLVTYGQWHSAGSPVLIYATKNVTRATALIERFSGYYRDEHITVSVMEALRLYKVLKRLEGIEFENENLRKFIKRYKQLNSKLTKRCV